MFYGGETQAKGGQRRCCTSSLLAVGVSSSHQGQPSYSLQRQLFGMSVECKNTLWQLN